MTIKAQTAPAERVRPRPLPSRQSDSEPQQGISAETLAACTAALLLIDDARLYGLIDGDAGIDRARCYEVLAELRERGVVPTAEQAEAKALEIMAELGTVRA